MDARTDYRESIVTRKEKENALTDLLRHETIEVNALATAIDLARQNSVNERLIQVANKKLEWLKYCKEVEQLLIQATQDKIKENLANVIERVEKENIVIPPKLLSDAKNIFNKLK